MGGPAPGAEVSSFFSKQWAWPKPRPPPHASTQAASTPDGVLGPSELDAKELVGGAGAGRKKERGRGLHGLQSTHLWKRCYPSRPKLPAWPGCPGPPERWAFLQGANDAPTPPTLSRTLLSFLISVFLLQVTNLKAQHLCFSLLHPLSVVISPSLTLRPSPTMASLDCGFLPKNTSCQKTTVSPDARGGQRVGRGHQGSALSVVFPQWLLGPNR